MAYRVQRSLSIAAKWNRRVLGTLLVCKLIRALCASRAERAHLLRFCRVGRVNAWLRSLQIMRLLHFHPDAAEPIVLSCCSRLHCNVAQCWLYGGRDQSQKLNHHQKELVMLKTPCILTSLLEGYVFSVDVLPLHLITYNILVGRLLYLCLYVLIWPSKRIVLM